MSDECTECYRKNGEHESDCRIARPAASELAAPTGYAVGGEFYQGVEWMACWLLDNVEGETISEEQLRPWAIEAWKAHLKRHNKVISQE